MDLKSINAKLKKIGDFDAEKELYSLIKYDLADLFLKENIDAIFVKSVDVYGFPLGFYAQTNKKKGKFKGEPYTMVDSGELRDGMFVKVYYRKIILGSTSPHGRQFEDEFGVHIFGVNSNKLSRIISKHIVPYLKKHLLID